MTPIILILVAVLVIGLGIGAAAWHFLRHRQQAEQTTKETAARLPFHWRYIAAPIAVLLVFAVLSAVFYPRLPAEVGYQFTPEGTPGGWLSRETAMVLLLAPQFFLALLAGLITMGMTRLGIFSTQPEGQGIRPRQIMSLVGNLCALPQLILGFTIFDIFIYNVYQVHLMPVWVSVLVLVISAIVIGIVFLVYVYRNRERLFYPPEDKQ